MLAETLVQPGVLTLAIRAPTGDQLSQLQQHLASSIPYIIFLQNAGLEGLLVCHNPLGQFVFVLRRVCSSKPASFWSELRGPVWLRSGIEQIDPWQTPTENCPLLTIPLY